MLRRDFLRNLFIGAAVACVALLWADRSWAQGNSAAAFERVKEVQARHTAKLMEKEGVVGTAIGLGEGRGHALVVLLEKPGIGGLPQELEGVPVRPFVSGKIYALKPPGGSPPGQDKKPPKQPDEPVDPTARFDRPVPIGVSTGHPDVTAGTIGCRVTDGTNVYALSNNHVYANENLASIGDPVIQPGAYDGGTSPADDIGTLAAFEPIAFDGSANTIDAAIASTTTALLGNATPSDGYGTPKSGTLAASINLPVKKYGRTTGLTKGKVYLVSAELDVGYDSGAAHFVDQIIIIPGGFSAGGDSGSLIVCDGKGRNKKNDRKPVGLLFAGSNTVTIANPIDLVLGALGVTIDGE